MSSLGILALEARRRDREVEKALAVFLALSLFTLGLHFNWISSWWPVGPRDFRTQEFWDPIFWSLTLQAFGLSWALFERLYRNPAWDFLITLPISSDAWFSFAERTLIFPFIISFQLSCLFAMPLVLAGEWEALIYALGLPIMATLLGFHGFIRLYLSFLRSMEHEGALRKQLSAGLPSPEAALLFYAPAFAFGGSMVVIMGLTFGTRIALLKELTGLAWAIPSSLPLLIPGLSQGSRELFKAHFPQLYPKFIDTERVLPFVESELPLHGVLHESLSPLNGIYRAAKVSLKRAHRVDLFGWVLLGILAVFLAQKNPLVDVFWLGCLVAFLPGFTVPNRFQRIWLSSLIVHPTPVPAGISNGEWIASRTRVALERSVPIGVLLVALIVAVQGFSWDLVVGWATTQLLVTVLWGIGGWIVLFQSRFTFLYTWTLGGIALSLLARTFAGIGS